MIIHISWLLWYRNDEISHVYKRFKEFLCGYLGQLVNFFGLDGGESIDFLLLRMLLAADVEIFIDIFTLLSFQLVYIVVAQCLRCIHANGALVKWNANCINGFSIFLTLNVHTLYKGLFMQVP